MMSHKASSIPPIQNKMITTTGFPTIRKHSSTIDQPGRSVESIKSARSTPRVQREEIDQIYSCPPRPGKINQSTLLNPSCRRSKSLIGHPRENQSHGPKHHVNVMSTPIGINHEQSRLAQQEIKFMEPSPNMRYVPKRSSSLSYNKNLESFKGDELRKCHSKHFVDTEVQSISNGPEIPLDNGFPSEHDRQSTRSHVVSSAQLKLTKSGVFQSNSDSNCLANGLSYNHIGEPYEFPCYVTAFHTPQPNRSREIYERCTNKGYNATEEISRPMLPRKDGSRNYESSSNAQTPSRVPRRQISMNELNSASHSGTFNHLPTSNSTISNLSRVDSKPSLENRFQKFSHSACSSPIDCPSVPHARIGDLSQSLQEYAAFTNVYKQKPPSNSKPTNLTAGENHRLKPLPAHSKIIPPFAVTAPKVTTRQRAQDLYSLVRCRQDSKIPFCKASSVPNERSSVKPIQSAVRPNRLIRQNAELGSFDAPGHSEIGLFTQSRDAPRTNPTNQALRRTAKFEQYEYAKEASTNQSNTDVDDKRSLNNHEQRSMNDTEHVTIDPQDKIDRHARGILDETEDLLLSLSKLASQPDEKSSMWDNSTCLSDVESDYAALGVILPFKTNLGMSIASLGSNDTQSLGDRNNPSYSDSEIPLDAGCPSEGQRKETSQHKDYPKFHLGKGIARLPVASVAPMMASSLAMRASKDSICSNTVYNSIEQNTVKKMPPRQKELSEKPSGCKHKQPEASQKEQSDAGHPLDGIKLPYPLTTNNQYTTAYQTPIKSSVSNYTITDNCTDYYQSFGVSDATFSCSRTAGSQNSVESAEFEQLRAELRKAIDNVSLLTNQMQSKDAEIEMLRNKISLLQSDLEHFKAIEPPEDGRPPRAHSCRPIKSDAVKSKPGNGQMPNGTRIVASGVHRESRHSSNSPANEQDRQGKKSKWIKPAIGKAFKKRSRSNVDTGERDHSQAEPVNGDRHSPVTATVFTNVYASRTTLVSTPNDEAVRVNPKNEYTALSQLREHIKNLEQDNQRLRQLLAGNIENGKATAWLPGREVTLNDILASESQKYSKILRVTCGSIFEGNSPNERKDEERSRDATESSKEISIGQLEVTEQMTWDELDNHVSELFKAHVDFLDPDNHLGFRSLNVSSYRILDNINDRKTLWSRAFSKDCSQFSFEPNSTLHINPFEFIQQNPEGYLQLNLAEISPTTENMLKLLAFESLIPEQTLRDYLTTIQCSWFTVLCGPAGFDKMKIAHGLLTCLRNELCLTNGYTLINSNATTTVEEVISKLNERTEINGQRRLVVLNGLHHMTGSMNQLMAVLRSMDVVVRPIVLATSDSVTKDLQTLEHEQSIRVLEHLKHTESTAGYMERYLKRKLINTRVNAIDLEAQHDEQHIMTSVVTWLPNVWQHLSRFLVPETLFQCDTLFNLRVFLNCPMQVNTSRKWFTELWDNLFIPFLFGTRGNFKSNQAGYTINWITSTWPWPRGENAPIKTNHDLLDFNEIPRGTDTVYSTPVGSLPVLRTFGIGANQNAASRPQQIKNRSSMDSGIVPDSFPTQTTNNSYLDNRSSLGSDSCDRLLGFEGMKY